MGSLSRIPYFKYLSINEHHSVQSIVPNVQIVIYNILLHGPGTWELTRGTAVPFLCGDSSHLKDSSGG